MAIPLFDCLDLITISEIQKSAGVATSQAFRSTAKRYRGTSLNDLGEAIVRSIASFGGTEVLNPLSESCTLYRWWVYVPHYWFANSPGFTDSEASDN